MKDHCRVMVNELPLNSWLLLSEASAETGGGGDVESKTEASRKRTVSELTASRSN